MFGDMMGKLQEMQQQMEETKKRLDTITVTGEAGGGAVKVEITANRKVRKIDYASELISGGDKEEIEDLTIVAMNRAIEQADKVQEAEMQSAAKGYLPPGLEHMMKP